MCKRAIRTFFIFVDNVKFYFRVLIFFSNICFSMRRLKIKIIPYHFYFTGSHLTHDSSKDNVKGLFLMTRNIANCER